MNKNEFLNTLKEALTDSVPASVVRENIQYYSSYIDEEEQKGRSEEEVLDELGSPRLIAHTIIDTTPEAASYAGNRGPASRGGTAYAGDDRYSSGRSSRRSGNRSSYHSFSLDMSKWYWKLIVYIVLIAIVMFLITVVSGIMSLLFPVLPIIIIVVMMMWMFGGHGR